MGQCPACREWNSFAEEPRVREAKGARGAQRKEGAAKPVPLSGIADTGDRERADTHFKELNRVLGGGLVPGSMTLIGGDPGIGKSTILLQAAGHLSSDGRKVLYISGEESLAQIKLRAVRIGSFSDTLTFLCETNLSVIEEVIAETSPEVVIIDSIQTMYDEEVASAPGSVSQVRESTGILMRIAKTRGIAVLIVGHVTKEGTVAGPRVLEHMVDTVLYFEGDRHASYRILRAVKNRFGSTNEIGVFEMRREGLVEVENPSEFMLSGRPEGASGSVVGVCIEGTRPLLLEIQALVTRTAFGYPRRQAQGTDVNRVNLLMAVLEKRAGLALSDQDAYVNLAGGVRVTEPALDLAICMAVTSAFRNRPLDDKTAVFGEVGLSGEIRAVSMAAQRVQEALNLGFTSCILPKDNEKHLGEVTGLKGIRIIGVATLADVMSLL